MIRHVHVNECDSTQDVLKEQLRSAATDEGILVSCEHQTNGRGRGDNIWASMPGTLCFSLNLMPHPILSLTAIELAVIVTEFFSIKGRELRLKWPNDLWTEDRKKCGGILVQGGQANFLAGIGINMFSDLHDYGGIYEHPFAIEKMHLAREIAHFIHDHRIPDPDLLRQKWERRCGHLHSTVTITEGIEVNSGRFDGLGDYGEALLSHSGKQTRIYNGSLRRT